MNILLRGTPQTKTIAEKQLQLDASKYDVVASIKMDVTRGNIQGVEQVTQEGDLIHFEFDDGGEWIVAAEDVEELQKVGLKRQALTGKIVIPSKIEIADDVEQRGLLKAAVVKIASLLRPKLTDKLYGEAARAIAQKLDKKMVSTPGLNVVTESFNLQPAVASEIHAGAGIYLLLIHGTATSTAGSFEHLKHNNWPDLFKVYSGRTLALGHLTAKRSQLQVVVQTLEQLRRMA